MKKAFLSGALKQEEQRFYARTAPKTTPRQRQENLKTSFDRARRHWMPPYQATPAALPRTRIHLALASFADEVVGTLARLFLYVGTLALIAVLALAGLGQLPSLHDDKPALKPGWSVADRSHQAFAVNRLDSLNKTDSYTILRHPEGGRRDILRWTGDAALPVAELEIYRAGGEFEPTARLPADMTARMASRRPRRWRRPA
jgi:hypothetical protein